MLRPTEKGPNDTAKAVRTWALVCRLSQFRETPHMMIMITLSVSNVYVTPCCSGSDRSQTEDDHNKGCRSGAATIVTIGTTRDTRRSLL